MLLEKLISKQLKLKIISMQLKPILRAKNSNKEENSVLMCTCQLIHFKLNKYDWVRPVNMLSDIYAVRLRKE